MSAVVVTKAVMDPPNGDEKEQMILEAEEEERDRRAKMDSVVELGGTIKSQPPSYEDVCGVHTRSPTRSVSSVSSSVGAATIWNLRQHRLARRLNTSASLCILLLLLLIVTLSIIGGAYLYRTFPLRHQSGWCRIPLGDDWDPEDIEAFRRHLAEQQKTFSLRSSAQLPMSTAVHDDAEPLPVENMFLEENFEIDIETRPDLEEIEVPDFGLARKGRFLHDFVRNLTGIVDYTDSRCFILPLDRSHVSPPKTLLDMVHKLQEQQYQVDTKRIRRTMRVSHPPLSSDARLNLGPYIPTACEGWPIYRLVPDEEMEEEMIQRRDDSDEDELDDDDEDEEEFHIQENPFARMSRQLRDWSRSVLSTLTRNKRSAAAPVLFREFAGQGVLELEIKE